MKHKKTATPTKPTKPTTPTTPAAAPTAAGSAVFQALMAKWDGFDWMLKVSTGFPEIGLEPGSENRFQFKAERDANQNILYFKLKSNTGNPVNQTWSDCSPLLFQAGIALAPRVLPGDRLKKSMPDPGKHGSLALRIRADKVDDLPYTFERLVGTIPFGGRIHPVAFYQASGCFDDNTTQMLIILLDQTGGNPGTVVAGNN